VTGGPDYSTWLTKQAAADTIGVTTKTVEAMAKAGQLQQASWRRPSGGPAIAVYHPDDVHRLATERRPGPSAFVLPPNATPSNGNGHGHRSLVSIDTHPSPATMPPGDDVLRMLFAAALRAVTSETSQKPEPLWVDLDQAAALTGLSRRRLLKCIRDGKLEAWRDAGERRVRRRDLEGL
jgi:excisionase family DNA binding protein